MNIRTYILFMVFRQQAPVKIWLHMMCTVIAIIEEHKVQGLTAEVASVIVWMIFIATIMLKIVCADNTPCSILMRNDPKEQSAFPVDHHQNDIDQYNETKLEGLLPEPLRFFFVHTFRKGKFPFQDIAAHGMKKEELIEEVDLVAHLGSADSVFQMLGVFVMAEVVTGHISTDRVAITKRQDKLKQLIHSLIFKDGGVNRIVYDDGA